MIHDKLIFNVFSLDFEIDVMPLFLHGSSEKFSEHFPFNAKWFPDQIEIYAVDIVLSDGKSVCNIENGVPPASWNEDSIAWPLQTLYEVQMSFFRFEHLWQVKCEVVDGFLGSLLVIWVVPSGENPLRVLVREDDPEFVSFETDVPSRGVERVDVEFGSRSSGPD